MIATPSTPTSVVSTGSDDDACVLHQDVTASRCDIHVRTSLDHIQCEALHHDTAMETPISAINESATDIDLDERSATLPLPTADLKAAATRLRPDPALQKALSRLLDGGWSYQHNDGLIVTFEPRSKGRQGRRSRPYTTTQDTCTCPGAIIRGGCYHPLAWHIVSEALEPTTSLLCALPSATFLPLCLLVVSSGIDQLILRADSDRGTLTLTALHMITGTVRVEMAAPVLLTIEQLVHATDLTRVIDTLGRMLPPEGTHLTLEVTAGSLLIIAGDEDAPLLVDGLDTLPITEHPEPSA